VWETINGGLNSTDWYATSPTLTKVYTDLHYIRALAFAPQDTATVYAGTSDGNMLYTNNADSGSAANWIDITVGNAEMPNRSVSGIAVSAVDTATAYVAFDGFNVNTPGTPGHLYQVRVCKIYCGLQTARWTDLSGNLPNIPVYAVVVNPMNAQQVFIGTEIGFYFTNNINVVPPVWNRFQTGLPVAAINHLTIDNGNTTLAAWTNGRGLYAVNLPAWRVVSSPSPSANSVLNAVTAVDSSHAWAVGKTANADQGLIEQWNGSSWITATNPISGCFNYLFGVSASSVNDIWAVGAYCNQSMFLHSAGGAWSSVAGANYSTITQLNAVKAVSPTLAWSVGYTSDLSITVPLIERWSGGSSWEGVLTVTNILTLSSGQFNGVAATDASNAWAVGSYNCATCQQTAQRTLIERWNGSSWNVIPSPNVAITQDNILKAVAAISTTDAWAIGYYNDDVTGSAIPLTLHWDGSSWRIISAPSINVFGLGSQLNAVSAVASDPNDVWTAGCYTFSGHCSTTLTMHWDGTSWKVFNSENVAGGSNALNGVAMVSHTDGWTVGYYKQYYDTQMYTLIERWVPYAKWWP
jgi:hypothetical protein